MMMIWTNWVDDLETKYEFGGYFMIFVYFLMCLNLASTSRQIMLTIRKERQKKNYQKQWEAHNLYKDDLIQRGKQLVVNYHRVRQQRAVD